MKRDKAFETWWGKQYAEQSTKPNDRSAFIAGWEAAIEEFVCKPAQDEHLPTLEGVVEYLETQNDIAFLAYRRLERGSEPGMDRQVRQRLKDTAEAIWRATGEALHKAKEAAKPEGPGTTFIETIDGLLDRHFLKRT